MVGVLNQWTSVFSIDYGYKINKIYRNVYSGNSNEAGNFVSKTDEVSAAIKSRNKPKQIKTLFRDFFSALLIYPFFSTVCSVTRASIDSFSIEKKM